MREFDALVDYFSLLERQGYEITLNDFSGLIVSDDRVSGALAPWFIHRNAFCMHMKSDAHLWNKCLVKKSALCTAAMKAVAADRKNPGFRGLCFCGREEYIVPVFKDGILLATLALGGFSSRRSSSLERARATLLEAGVQTEVLAKLELKFDEAVTVQSPEDPDARAILGLAASVLAGIYGDLESSYGTLVLPGAARLGKERRIALHAADFMRRNHQKKISGHDAADACHVSLSTLSHVFKKCMGVSISAWLSAFRIEQAKLLLARGESVTSAAMESGFDDPNYFSRVFSATAGIPPGLWAKRQVHRLYGNGSGTGAGNSGGKRESP